MLVVSLVLVVVVLPLAGVVLAYNFRSAVISAFDERLEALSNVVLASANYDPIADTLTLNRELGDPRFDRVFSGWYWQITDGQNRLLTSRSLWDQQLEINNQPGLTYRAVSGPNGRPARLSERDVRLPGLPVTLHVSVAGEIDEIEAEVAEFQRLLWLSLLVLGSLLLLAVWLQLRWGLEPLRRVQKSLEAVQRGQENKLDTDLPSELRPLAGTINAVLEQDQRFIERGRAAAGNLAHALKTPVSVISTLSEQLPSDQARALRREVKRLDLAVRHHLARASAAGTVAVGRSHDVMVVLDPVLTGIARLAGRRALRFTAPAGRVVTTRVDPQDLQEIVGNVLENAIKWARSEVIMTVDADNDGLLLRIQDDGPGMSDAQIHTALDRGVKLDETTPGSGLGLSIVSDLAKLYGGHVSLTRWQDGGLTVEIRLPEWRASQ